MNKIFENYDVFYEMVLSVTILSNSQSEEFKHDASKVIDFIGNAYYLEKSIIEEFKDIILNDLNILGLISDRDAEEQRRFYEGSYEKEDILREIKCKVLNEIEGIYDRIKQYQNRDYFNYKSYHLYNSKIRFYELNNTGFLGIVAVTKLLGILYFTGIGCKRDYQNAVIRLKQCVYWGDIPAMNYLSYVYKRIDMESESLIMEEVTKLSNKYLNLGITVLPKDVKCSIKAQEEYVCISSIYQDVIRNLNKVDIVFSFVEAILLEKLTYQDRLNLINNFDAGKWKNLTNSSSVQKVKIGF